VLDGGEIGKYGGTWLRAATSDFDVFIIEYRFGYSSLFRWSPLGDPIVPHLATRLEASDDQRSFVVHLRKGVRWSDGQPYTADDLIYWWKHEDLSETVGDGKPTLWLTVGGGKTTVEKLDEHAVRFSFEHPYGNFLENLASFSLEMSAAPAHYLEKYHPDLGDPAFIEREMESLGFSSPRSLYAAVRRFNNPECPRLWPWVARAHSPSSPYVYVRNPYYFAVDPQGNQLPYIDRLQFDVKS
jgi:ABC-type transport system substrate-binding protein